MTIMQKNNNHIIEHSSANLTVRFDKLVRALTLAPVLAMLSLTAIAIGCPDVFPAVGHYVYAMLFLGILPLLAYPLQPVMPHFKEKGRSGQRTLAMLFAVAGYLLCTAVNAVTAATPAMWLIVLEYLISGLLILVFNKGLHIKLSAHGCGSAGPVVLLLYFGLPIPAILMAALTVLAYISSVRAGHHTMPQLIGGSAVSILLLPLLVWIL